MENHQVEVNSEEWKAQRCNCSHRRDDHSTSRDCDECGCQLFVTPESLNILAKLKPKAEPLLPPAPEKQKRPPLVTLHFADGHTEQRPNYIHADPYRDVQEEDGEDGEVRVTWWKREREDINPLSGFLLQQHYVQIDPPVDAVGKPKVNEHVVDSALYAMGLPKSAAARMEAEIEMARLLASYRKARASQQLWNRVAWFASAICAVTGLVLMRACS